MEACCGYFQPSRANSTCCGSGSDKSRTHRLAGRRPYSRRVYHHSQLVWRCCWSLCIVAAPKVRPERANGLWFGDHYPPTTRPATPLTAVTLKHDVARAHRSNQKVLVFNTQQSFLFQGQFRTSPSSADCRRSRCSSVEAPECLRLKRWLWFFWCWRSTTS